MVDQSMESDVNNIAQELGNLPPTPPSSGSRKPRSRVPMATKNKKGSPECSGWPPARLQGHGCGKPHVGLPNKIDHHSHQKGYSLRVDSNGIRENATVGKSTKYK